MCQEKGAGVVATPHGVLPRDSHEISPTIGGVHKLQILIREKYEDFLRNFFGEEIGGSGGHDNCGFKNSVL